MEVAIANVLAGTKRRLCKWQVQMPVQIDFHRIMNQMLTKEEIERAWHDMLNNYCPEKNLI
jgi:hypothetical protein